ncbi:hypothetical protein LJR219_002387 [Phenylobacterium sp. LjRoot219]|uniref:hypothetical protein n=1 Tax=Phenylobacterium sp. LjRoot219 TaxID=3342283 RepID=UPI003ECCAD0E
MLPYARLTPGAGFRPGRSLLYYAQRLAPLPGLRRAVATLLAAGLRWLHGELDGPPLDVPGARALATLRREGLTRLPPLMTPEAVRRMARYFAERPVICPDGEPRPVDELPAAAACAEYPLQTVLECPGLLALLNAPSVLRLAEAYLGCKPTLSSVGVRWSLPAAGAPPPRYQGFHRDVDDWRFLKLFIYLTDVGADCGPHLYVRGSHRRRFGFSARKYELAEIATRFGDDSLLTITGPAGAAFIADTLGVHCGGPPTGGARLMLQAQYSILPVFAFDYAPLERGARGIDSYCNRLFLRPAASDAALRN